MPASTHRTGRAIFTVSAGYHEFMCQVTIITDKMTKKIDKLQLNMIKLNHGEIVTKYMII